MPKFPLAEWRVEQVRVTIFPMTEVRTELQNWWQAVVLSEPDNVTASPKQHSGSVQGTFGAGQLVLKSEPGRVDWLFVPAESVIQESVMTGELPSVGALEEATQEFSTVVEQWLSLDDLPVVGRIAFGAVLGHAEVSREAAYERVPEYLPVLLPPGSSDFSLQINRPQQSATGIDGLTINRLTRWNVVSLKLQAAGMVISASSPAYLRVELDMNTAPTFTGPIPGHRLIEIYKELVSQGMQIAANGVPTL